MNKDSTNVIRKHICLTAAGITLQTLGTACLFAATLVVMKEINAQIKQTLLQELAGQSEKMETASQGRRL